MTATECFVVSLRFPPTVKQVGLEGRFRTVAGGSERRNHGETGCFLRFATGLYCCDSCDKPRSHDTSRR